MIAFRPVNLPTDRQALLALDRSFVTDQIYRVSAMPFSFVLEAVHVDPPVRKELPLADDLGGQRAWTDGLVAEADGELVAFVAWTHEAWNQRTLLWHLYVASGYRGRGIGRRLVEKVVEVARSAGTRCVWLETSSINAPAIAFYRHLGFTLSGLDTSLYDQARLAADETALYFVRLLD